MATAFQYETSPEVTKFLTQDQKKQNLPKWTCRSCGYCNSSNCSFYGRRVDPRVNKCFNHTNYHPVSSYYKSPTNIEEIAMENEEKNV